MKIIYYFIIGIFSLLSLYSLETILAIEKEEKNLNQYPNDVIFKKYIDDKYNFTIMYPYKSDRNNPQISVDSSYQVTFSIPLVKRFDKISPFVFIQMSDLNELKNQYEKRGIKKEIDEIAHNFHPDETTKYLFPNYNLLNSSFVHLDEYLFSVFEISYLLPIKAQQIIEKDVQTTIDDKFIKLVLWSEPSDYQFYERVFDNMIKTFRLN